MRTRPFISSSSLVLVGFVVGAGFVLGCSSSSATATGEDAGRTSDAGGKDAGTANDGAKESGKDAGTANDASKKGSPDSGTEPGCALKASCTGDHLCAGTSDNTGKTKFGLRMSEIALTAPAALATGIVATTVAGAVEPDVAACNLTGTGTFSWLLGFDTTASTLEVGGAKPVANPASGYAFDTETITAGASFMIQPVTYAGVSIHAGAFATTAPMDLILPIFLDSTATSAVLLPTSHLSVQGTLSADQDCIGSYNAAGLDPANSCAPDGMHPQFLTGGKATGFISLATADTVVISAVNETLCALLAGGGANVTMQASGVTACKHDASGNILFQGDWCSTTDAAATAMCADAVALSLTYAASATTITN